MFRVSRALRYNKNLVTAAQAELKSISGAGLFKDERVITSAQSAGINVENLDKRVLNFCSNNYLGLSSHPRVIDTAKSYLDSHGAGLSSVRFICGTMDIHKKLEATISEFLDREDTILYPSGFDANAGVFEAILTPEDAVISDALNHASIIDGIRLCKAQRHRYEHLNLADLEEKLQKTQESRIRMVVTDGVFSMDGDVAPLDKIVELCQKYDAALLVDDCHATGFIGPAGKGTPHLFGVEKEVDLLHSTLGKALGGASGGFSSGAEPLITLQRQRSRTYLFSNALAPPVVGATQAAFELLAESTELIDHIRSNTKLFRQRMSAAGFTISGSEECAIAPVMLGDASLASQFSNKLLERGVYVIGFSFPVVPKGAARIRVQMSAGHSAEEVNAMVDAFIEVGKEMKVI